MPTILHCGEEGRRARPRSEVIKSVLNNIHQLCPSIAILENVVGFASKPYRQILDQIVQSLVGMYVVEHRVMNSHHYGHPQNRTRWYLIAIKEEKLRHPMSWPPKIPVCDRP